MKSRSRKSPGPTDGHLIPCRALMVYFALADDDDVDDVDDDNFDDEDEKEDEDEPTDEDEDEETETWQVRPQKTAKL